MVSGSEVEQFKLRTEMLHCCPGGIRLQVILLLGVIIIEEQLPQLLVADTLYLMSEQLLTGLFQMNMVSSGECIFVLRLLGRGIPRLK